MKAYFDELKTNQIQKKAIYDKVNAINDDIQELETQKEKAKKKIDPKYNKVEMIPRGLA